MKRLQDKYRVKILAVILLIICCLTFVAGSLGVYAFSSYGMYGNSKKEIQERFDQDIQAKYSVTALARYLKKTDREPGENYHYAIYEGKLKKTDLEKAKVLFSTEKETLKSTDVLQIHTFAVNDESDFRLADNLFDEAYVHEFSEYTKYYFVDFCRVKGMDGLFLIGEDDSVYRLGDDFWYTQKSADEQESVSSESPDGASSANSAKAEVPGDSREAEDSALEKTEVFVKDSAGSIISVSPGELEEINLSSDEMVLASGQVDQLDVESREFSVSGEEEEYTNYTVASYVNRPLTVNEEQQGDFFVQAERFIDFAYRMRYVLIALIPITAGMSLLLLIFLLWAAGHREGTEGVCLRGLERVPTDLSAAIAFILISCAVGMTGGVLSSQHNLVISGITLGFGVSVTVLAAVLFLMNLSANLKTKTVWKRSVLRRIWHILRRVWGRVRGVLGGVRRSAAGVSMGKRIWLFFILFVILELIGMLIFQYELGGLLFVWLIEKVLFLLILAKVLREFGRLKEAGKRIAEGNLSYRVDTGRMFLDFEEHGETLNQIGEGLSEAVEERMKSERMKTELITNVSHDIKTPLTSIINYADLLSGLELEDPRAKEYIEVLSRQSDRLKKLIEDLIEASKASSGSLPLNPEDLDVNVILMQAVGEFDEKMKARGIDYRVRYAEPDAKVRADSRYLWRIFDNLLTNISKYSMPGTRAYIDVSGTDQEVHAVFRNISEAPLNITGDELKERFVRGDSSRSTEGSGLGLSIAESLATLMGGRLDLTVDGDLFKVELTLKRAAD